MTQYKITNQNLVIKFFTVEHPSVLPRFFFFKALRLFFFFKKNTPHSPRDAHFKNSVRDRTFGYNVPETWHDMK